MSDLSRLSLQELIALYAERELDLEALAAEVQRRQDMAKKRWDAFIEEVRKFVDHARQLASNFLNAWRASILIKQYEKEIQRVETLLKYTKHSKKRQEHERYLKWLHKQLERLANDSTNDNIIDNISAITIDNINAINRCEEGGSV